VTAFHALCEGMTGLELRHRCLAPHPEQLWRNAFQALLAGYATDIDTE
jgi:hypothetical protein